MLEQVVVEDVSVVTGRRAAQRARLQLQATLETTTGSYKVMLRNLSCTGAMVEGDALPWLGRTVALMRDGLDVLAKVVWTSGDRCGLHFDDPISLDEVLFQAQSQPEPPLSRPSRCYGLAGVEVERLSREDWMRTRNLVLRSMS